MPFTDILDVMRDTGFIGIRLTDFPRCFETYDLTPSQMEKEVSKRKLHVCTISFGGPCARCVEARQNHRRRAPRHDGFENVRRQGTGGVHAARASRPAPI